MFNVQTFIALILSSVAGIACYVTAGNSLDLFIGTIVFACILTPPFSAIAGQSPGGLVYTIGICLCVSCCWVMPVYLQVITFWQWAICMLVLVSFNLLLMSLMRFLLRLKLQPVLASGIVTVNALAWLTWPIWLSASLTGSQLRWSVMFQPIFAINHVVSHLGIWTEQQVAYNLTSLGQDVQYQLPTSAWPIIGLQFGLAGVMLIFSRGLKRVVT